MSRVFLGHISSANGLGGDVLIKSHTADPAAIGNYGPLANEADDQHFKLRVKRVTAKGVIAHIAGVDTRTAAEDLRGTKLFVNRDKLPAPDPDEFYMTDLIGLTAEHADGARFGSIVDVQNFGAGDLLEIQPDGQTATELVPFTKAFVPQVDLVGERVVVEMAFAETDTPGSESATRDEPRNVKTDTD